MRGSPFSRGSWRRSARTEAWVSSTMGRAGVSRQQVELLDAQDAEADAPAPPRRGRWWWAVLPVGLVAVLVVVQAVADARERAALAGLADLPGVVSPVEASVGVRWS